MSESRPQIDPTQVFNPEYWGVVSGELQPFIEAWPATAWGAKKDIAYRLMGSAQQIIEGQITGPLIVGEMFDPADPNLAATNPVNLPGAVLLLDEERLTTLGILEREHKQLSDAEPDPLDLSRSTREMIQRAGYRTEQGDFAYFTSVIRRANDTHVYERTSGIVVIVPNKKGTGTPLYATGNYPEVNNGNLGSVALTTDWRFPREIGATYTRRPAPGTDIEFRRITGIEICIPGEALPEKSRKIARFSGSMSVTG